MSLGVFGGLFSHPGAETPSVPMVQDAALQPASGFRVDRRFEYALDSLPVNAMFCDRELILRYHNRS